MGILLNIINTIMGYNDIKGVTNNPTQKYFDWSRRYNAIPAKDATSDVATLQPGESVVIFDGTRTLPDAVIAGTTEVSLKRQVPSKSIYRLQIKEGGALKTQRATGFTAATSIQVSVNNNAIAILSLADASNGDFSSVIVGDIVRIKGQLTNDSSDLAFSPINSGYWTVIAKDPSNLKITVVRPKGQKFQAITESVMLGADDTDSQIMIYASSGVQVGDMVQISGTLSPASYGAFEVAQVAPEFIDFVSGSALPEELGLLLNDDSDMFVYSDSKQFIYIESDQNTSIRYNNDSSDNNRINPVQAGNEYIPGFSSKWGFTWRCEIVNKSEINTATVKWIVAE